MGGIIWGLLDEAQGLSLRPVSHLPGVPAYRLGRLELKHGNWV